MSDSTQTLGHAVEILAQQTIGIAQDKAETLTFLHNLWADASFAEFYWQLAALLLILPFSWWLSNRWQRRAPTESDSAVKAFGAGGLQRIFPPLIALFFIVILHKTLQFLHWEHLNLLYFQQVLVLGWAVVRIQVYILRCVLPHSPALDRWERPLCFAIWSIPLLEITGLLSPIIKTLEQISFSAGKQTLNLWMLLHGTITVFITVLIALWVASLIENRLMASTHMDRNVREVLARLTKSVLTVIALLFSLSLVGIDVTALSVFSGALAVGLGFGLQKIASNYVSGFIILLDRSLCLGNLVTIDDKTTGTVTQINTRYTVLRMLNGTEAIIPNEYLMSNIVRNLSYTDTRLAVSISLQVAYDSDLEKTLALMVDTALEHPRLLKEPRPGAVITGFADNGINLDLGFWVGDPELGTGGVRSEVSLAIWKAFRANGIEFPYPQREVRLVGQAEKMVS